jgi:uncharacterized repeat protein (TIGR04076 family)
MFKQHKVKITVLKRLNASDIFEEMPVTPLTSVEACELFKDGQEFIVSEDGKMPEGFCTPAWNTIHRNIWMLRFGGNLPWYEEKGVAVVCCEDGLRPVIFKLERT